MTTIGACIKRHPVLTYYALVFTITWGGALIVFGPGVFLGTKEISFAGQSPLVYLAIFGGASIAGILSTGLVYGKAGLRDVGSRLLRWRVGVRWYAVALITAPLFMTGTLFALSLTSPVYLPAFVTSTEKASLLMTGIVIGIVWPFFEELGWTGFAIPELRKRYGILGTGLIVGLLWGLWHLPLFAGSASNSKDIPPALYLAVLLFSWLPPYRVLMVWVYDRTKSLLVIMLMHTPIVVGSFVLTTPAMLGAPVATYDLVFAAALWMVLAAVAVANGGHLESRVSGTR